MPDLTPTEHSLESDRERAREIAERGLILRTTVGSVVHGLSNPGTDDRDEMGVCVEPPEYLLGFRRFEHFVFRTQPEGKPSGPGDLDLTVYGLRKYCRLALKGSPTTLLPLFVNEEDVIARTPAGEELQALAPAFVARSTGPGVPRLPRRPAPRAHRRAARDAHAGALAPARLRHQVRDARAADRLPGPGAAADRAGSRCRWPSRERTALREVRAGKVPLEDVLEHLDRVTLRLEVASKRRDLPAKPDIDAVDAFVVRTYLAAWG